jgi:hypothetical protein
MTGDKAIAMLREDLRRRKLEKLEGLESAIIAFSIQGPHVTFSHTRTRNKEGNLYLRTAIRLGLRT